MIDGCVLTANNLSGDGIAHGFFTRQGGVSKGDYDSLNCGYGSDDERASVAENRRRISEHLGSSLPDVTTVYQVHSAEVVHVEEPFAPDTVPKADALVTTTPGLPIGALAADCTPVLFADPHAKVIGAAHAGWRGAVAGVLAATVDAMEQLGADRTRIAAAIGPTIHQPNYEVGPEFEAQFLEQDASHERFFTTFAEGGRPHFDLPGYCRHSLEAARIGSILDLDRCTYADDSLFFSFRRKTHLSETDYGRQISAIVIT